MSVATHSTVRSLREEAGLTVLELAYKSGVSVPSIYRMETGSTSVRRILAQKVLNILSKDLERKITLDAVDIKLVEK